MGILWTLCALALSATAPPPPVLHVDDDAPPGGDGPAFVVNVEGLNACTGDTVMLTFTGSGGAVGEDFCATLMVNTAGGGYCCSTQVCVPVPDGAPSPPPCDIDGDDEIGATDFLALLDAWGPNPGHPADLDGDGEVGVSDFLLLLAAWGPCA